MMAIIVVTHVPTTRANIVFLKLLASSRMPPISSRMLRVSSRWAAATPVSLRVTLCPGCRRTFEAGLCEG